jgi:hypothetical protein
MARVESLQPEVVVVQLSISLHVLLKPFEGEKGSASPFSEVMVVDSLLKTTHNPYPFQSHWSIQNDLSHQYLQQLIVISGKVRHIRVD